MKFLKSMEQTCGACPSQWEGELDDGTFIYVRYRWGNFSVGIAETLDEAISTHTFSCKIGGEYSGFLTNNEMYQLLAKNLQIHSTIQPNDARLRKS
jgi:hypothetical protein